MREGVGRPWRECLPLVVLRCCEESRLSLSGLLGRADFLVASEDPRPAAARSWAFIWSRRCARLPAVMRCSASSAASADVFALRRPSSSARPSAIDLRGWSRGPGVRFESDEAGLPVEVRELGRMGVVDGGRLALEAVLDRCLPGVAVRRAIADDDRCSSSPPATEDRPERADRADWGRAVASVGGCAEMAETLEAGQNMPLPGSHAKYCTLCRASHRQLPCLYWTRTSRAYIHSPIDASVVLALARAGSGELESGVEAGLEGDGAEVPEHARVAGAVHDDLVAELEVLSPPRSSSASTCFDNLGRRRDGVVCEALCLLVGRIDGRRGRQRGS